MTRMALKDRIQADIGRVFMNFNHFAEEHTWNNVPITCVVDDYTALKRKNNNVVDLSWDNNTTERLIYTPVDAFPFRLQPNEAIFFDGQPMKVFQYNEDMGIYTILLSSNDPKAVAY